MNYSSEAIDYMRQIEENGFVILRDAVDKNLISEVAQKVKRDQQNNKEMWHSTDRNRDSSFMLHEELLSVLDLPVVAELSNLVCGFDHRVDHVLTIKSRITAESVQDVKDLNLQTVHGGPFSNGGLNHYLPGFPLDKAVPRCGRLNLGVPLTPGNDSIGNCVFLKGSHVYKDYLCCVENGKGLGGAPLPYLEELEKSCPAVIPDVKPGDLFLFADALFHGTTKHLQDRITVYFMLTKGTATLMDYNTMARPYFDVAKTENQKFRFMPPWYFVRNTTVYAAGESNFVYSEKFTPFPGSEQTIEENRWKFLKRFKEWI